MPFVRLIFTACLTLSFLSAAPPTVRSETPLAREPAPSVDARVGLGGISKAGSWTPVRVTLAADAFPADARVELATADGDGLSVAYSPVSTHSPATESPGLWRYGKQGPVREPMLVRVLAGDGDELATVTLANRVLPSTDRQVVVFGDLGDFDMQVLRRVGLSRDAVVFSSFQDPETFPDHWIGCDAIDTLIVTTRDAERIERLTDRQFLALRRWVEMGGRLVLSVGESGERLLADGARLAEFLPGQFEGVSRVRSTSGLESFATATERLEPFPAVELSDVRGIARVHDGVAARRDQPLVVESPFGLGQLVFVAFDLDDPAIARWPSRDVLLGKLLVGERPERDVARDDTRGLRVTHFGYEDVTGQLRAALDQFPGVRVVAFSAIAGLIAIYILLIGPGDYFFLKRVVRRMSWSWLTFPLLVTAFAVASMLMVGAMRGRQIRVNQVDLVDLDVSRGIVRGTTWAHVYTPTPRSLDVRLEPATADIDVRDSLLTWQGLPGKGLGGLNAPMSGSLLPAASYRIRLEDDRPGDLKAVVAGFPLRASATVSLVGRWTGESEAVEVGSLEQTTTANLLAGTIVNPWPFALHDATLLYGEWVYAMSGEFAPGQRLEVDRQLTPRNLSWRLTRRRVVESRDVSTPWDPTATDDVPRILEIMMFHEAAGGASYTRLSHRHQPYLDMSEHLRFGRAVLVGRADEPATHLRLDGVAGQQPDSQHYNFYRVIIPVRDGAAGTDR